MENREMNTNMPQRFIVFLATVQKARLTTYGSPYLGYLRLVWSVYKGELASLKSITLQFAEVFLILIVAIFFVGCSLQGPVPNAPKGTRMETRLAKTWMAMEHEMPKEEPETPEPETPEPETPEPETPEPETPEPETPEPETPPPESKEPKPYYSSA
ncbi:hypothetical protein J6590_025962 [Homalodisca vitripennis]|nr:hypothetical protein J6590_025962 [Homalodisca vitripennis]